MYYYYYRPIISNDTKTSKNIKILRTGNACRSGPIGHVGRNRGAEDDGSLRMRNDGKIGPIFKWRKLGNQDSCCLDAAVKKIKFASTITVGLSQ